MKGNCKWSIQEDKYLKQIAKEQDGKYSWTKIAEKLNKRFSNMIRLAKQCRERFINHLGEQNDRKVSWSQQQAKLLITLYQEKGSKWKQISQQLPGKSQNVVKNKLYSVIRKLIRLLNFQFKDFYSDSKKEIRYESIMKIFQYSEGKFRTKPELDSKSKFLRSKIISEALHELEKAKIHMEKEEIKKFFQQINTFILAIRSCRPKKKEKYDKINNVKENKKIQNQDYEQTQKNKRQYSITTKQAFAQQFQKNNGHEKLNNSQQKTIDVTGSRLEAMQSQKLPFYSIKNNWVFNSELVEMQFYENLFFISKTLKSANQVDNILQGEIDHQIYQRI